MLNNNLIIVSHNHTRSNEKVIAVSVSDLRHLLLFKLISLKKLVYVVFMKRMAVCTEDERIESPTSGQIVGYACCL